MPLNPQTGAAWTPDELNRTNDELQFGFESQGGDAHPFVTQAYLEVVTKPPDGVATTSRYDKLGRLVQVNDATATGGIGGNQTTLQYDLGGRKIDMVDPDMGHWTYGYYAAGNLKTQTDARGITTTLVYDDLQRLRSKSYSNSDPAVTFHYDSYETGGSAPTCPTSPSPPFGTLTAVGRMTHMTDGAGDQYSCFDVRGGEAKTRRTVSGAAYDIDRGFDELGQVADLTYPADGGGTREVLDSTTDSRGNLTGLSSTTYGDTILSAATRKPWGAPDSLLLGNGETTSYTYDSRLRTTGITTGAAGTNVQSLALTYDDASNVKSVADSTTGETVSYTYDQLNRLTGGTGFSGGQAATYSYNQIGNLLTKQEGTSSLTLAYPASGQPRPHAVTSTSDNPALALGYDANGNLATQGTSTYTYDAEDRLKARTVTGGQTYYTYDGNGVLLQRSGGGPQTTTVHPNGEGAYARWTPNTTVTPAYAHYQEVDEDPASTTDYLQNGVRSHRDTQTYPSAALPPGVLIDKVTLVFHWQGGTIRPLFVGMGAQAGVVREGPAYVRGGTYGDDRWELTSNPASGQPWTLDELNRVTGPLEFGFEVDAQDTGAPQVAQAYVEVAYHVPTTTYIGGLFEKTDTGSVTKYYGGVAMRQVPAGGGAGTLLYLLKDHLGSTVGVMDAFGAVLSTQKYWPYGATRAGSLSQTDKLYTGQQIEYGDSALGLYNYKARFYSTVTGRFASADPTLGGGLNRYAYVSDNPLTYNDPTGHDPSQEDLDNCAAHIVACYEFSYGISPNGFVIVMGLGEGINGGDWGGPKDYSGYGQTFLERYDPGCKGRAGTCWDAAMTLLKQAGPDAVYDVFGLMFIESDVGGRAAPALARALVGGRAVGGDALAAIIGDPRGKRLRGVLGESLGAITVSDFYADPANKDVKVPFFLDSPPDIKIQACIGGFGWCVPVTLYELDVDPAAEKHARYAGTFGFFSGQNCKNHFHCANNQRADEVFNDLAKKED